MATLLGLKVLKAQSVIFLFINYAIQFFWPIGDQVDHCNLKLSL